MTNVRRESDSAKPEPLSRWWGLVVLAVVLTVGGIVSGFEPAAVAEAVGGSAGVILYLAVGSWSRRAERWFWPFMGVATVAHAIAIVLIPWPPHRPWMKYDTFFGVVDLFAWVGLAMLLERLSKRLK